MLPAKSSTQEMLPTRVCIPPWRLLCGDSPGAWEKGLPFLRISLILLNIAHLEPLLFPDSRPSLPFSLFLRPGKCSRKEGCSPLSSVQGKPPVPTGAPGGRDAEGWSRTPARTVRGGRFITSFSGQPSSFVHQGFQRRGQTSSLWLQGCASIWEPPHHSESVLCRVQPQSSPRSHTHLPVAKGSFVGFWLGPFLFVCNFCDKTSRHPEWSWRLQKLSPVPSAPAPSLVHPLSRHEAFCLPPGTSPPVRVGQYEGWLKVHRWHWICILADPGRGTWWCNRT